MFLKNILDKHLSQRAYHVLNFSVNVKSLKIKKEKIMEMITKELINNNLFTQRALVLH